MLPVFPRKNLELRKKGAHNAAWRALRRCSLKGLSMWEANWAHETWEWSLVKGWWPSDVKTPNWAWRRKNKQKTFRTIQSLWKEISVHNQHNEHNQHMPCIQSHVIFKKQYTWCIACVRRSSNGWPKQSTPNSNTIILCSFLELQHPFCSVPAFLGGRSWMVFLSSSTTRI